MSWHVDSMLLAQYRRNQLSDAWAASVEMHVTSCADCRNLVSEATDGAGPARAKVRLDEGLDDLALGRTRRWLRRLGVGDADAGLLAASLCQQGSWFSAFAIVLGFASLAASAGSQAAALGVFLLVAPLVPLAGVAFAYGPRVDPTHETTLATSLPAARLILLRTIAVAGPALPVMVLLSALLPGGSLAFTWLLPAVGLATTALALGTLVPLHRAAVGLGAAWVIAAGTALVSAPRSGAEVFVQAFAAFRASGQLLFAAVAVASLLVAVARRGEFEIAR